MYRPRRYIEGMNNTTATTAALEAEYLTICEALSNAMDAQDSQPTFSAGWQDAQPAVNAARAAREAREASHRDFLEAARKSAISAEAAWNI